MKKVILFTLLSAVTANAGIQMLEPVFSQSPDTIETEVISQNKIRVAVSGFSSCDKDGDILVSNAKPEKKLRVINFYRLKKGGPQLSSACENRFSHDIFVTRPIPTDATHGDVTVFLNFDGNSIPEEMVKLKILVNIIAEDFGTGTVEYNITKINKIEITTPTNR